MQGKQAHPRKVKEPLPLNRCFMLDMGACTWGDFGVRIDPVTMKIIGGLPGSQAACNKQILSCVGMVLGKVNDERVCSINDVANAVGQRTRIKFDLIRHTVDM